MSLNEQMHTYAHTLREFGIVLIYVMSVSSKRPALGSDTARENAHVYYVYIYTLQSYRAGWANKAAPRPLQGIPVIRARAVHIGTRPSSVDI